MDMADVSVHHGHGSHTGNVHVADRRIMGPSLRAVRAGRRLARSGDFSEIDATSWQARSALFIIVRLRVCSVDGRIDGTSWRLRAGLLDRVRQERFPRTASHLSLMHHKGTVADRTCGSCR